MDLSIAIVSWNTRDVLDRCLESIFETTHSIEYEVIVVDNASSDGSAEMVRKKYPQVKLIENRDNVGFSTANNQAYAAGGSRHFLLLNPDTLVYERALDGLVRFLDDNPGTGAVGPLVLNKDGSLQVLLGEVSDPLERGAWNARPAHKGACPAARQRRGDTKHCPVYGRLGWRMLLDDQARGRGADRSDGRVAFYGTCEETDWCLRLHRAGWEVRVVPAAEIMHYGAKSSEQASESSRRRLVASKISYFKKHRGRLHACSLAGAMILKNWLRRRIKGLRSCARR